MITLLPTRLHWLPDNGLDCPYDLCAHSPVRFEVDRAALVEPQHGDFCVSASAIYLLRTLKRDHSRENPVGEHLFPCCGHAIYDPENLDVLIIGCGNGRDFSVTHHNDGTVTIVSTDGAIHHLPPAAWENAVHTFVDAVQDFYDLSQPKIEADEFHYQGFVAMRSEWQRRRGQRWVSNQSGDREKAL